MKLAVVGSRTYPLTAEYFAEMPKTQQTEARKYGKRLVWEYLRPKLKTGDSVVSGAAKGPDTWGVELARDMQLGVEEIPADWSKGKGAGFKRNGTIVSRADAVVAFWDGVSRGTLDTIKKAHASSKPVCVVFGDPRRIRANKAWEEMFFKSPVIE